MQRSTALIVVAILLGVVIGLGAYTFIYAKGYSYLTSNPAACANCHVMQAQYDAWQKSSHHSVATCNDCHTPHNLIGKYAVKANHGFWHSFYFTSGNYPDTIEITKFDNKMPRMPVAAVTRTSLRPSTAMSYTARPKACNARVATIRSATLSRLLPACFFF